MTPRRLLLVAAGGTIGTAARLLIALGVPEADGFPFATLAVNVLGALLIGILAARSGPGDIRVFFGTGILGGFTTYSALAVTSVQLWGAMPLLAVVYAAASLLLGVAACALGMRLGRRRPAGAAR